jgi:hypothetical protein
MWVTNEESNNVVKLRAKDGAVLGTLRLEKSLRLCLAGLRIRRFDPIAEAS